MAVFSLAGRAASSSRQREPEVLDDSLLKSIGRGTASGLSTVGNFLDLPGSMVRDTLGGENPFDQLLSPFSSDNRLSGRDLTTKAGLTRRNNPNKWEAADFGGFAAEVLLDPLTYMTFGASAAGKAGRLAGRSGQLRPFVKATGKGKRLGAMTSTLEDMVGTFKGQGPEGAAKLSDLDTAARGMGFRDLDDAVAQIGKDKLSGAVGFGLPFTDPAFSAFTGPRAQKFAAGMDKAGAAVAASPPGRLLRYLFDRKAGNQYGKQGQKLAEEVIEAKDAAKPVASKAARDVESTIRSGEEAFLARHGEKVTAPKEVRLDPSDVHVRATELAKAQNELFADQYPDFYKWKGENLGLVNKVRAAHNKGLDWNSIERMDETFDELRNRYGLYNADDETIWRMILDKRKPKAGWDDLLRQAEGEIREDIASGVRPQVAQGNDVVEFTTRTKDGTEIPQQGMVIEPGTRTSKVLLHNDRDGTLFTRVVDNKKLKRLDVDDATREQWAKLQGKRAFSDVVNRAGEKGDVGRAMREVVGEADDAGVGETVSAIRAAKDPVHQRIIDKGGKSGVHSVEEGSLTEHMPRTGHQSVFENAKQREGIQTSFSSMHARDPVWRDVPIDVANEIATNSRYRGDKAAQNIREDFDEWLNEEFGVDNGGQGELDFDFNVGAIEAMDPKMAHAEALAERAKNLPKADLFRRTIEREMADYVRNSIETEAGIDALHSFAAGSAREASTEGDLAVTALYEAAGLNAEKAVQHLAKLKGISVDEAKKLRVDSDVVAAATQFQNLMNPKKLEGPLLNVIDKMTKWFKDNVTVGWPAFWGRNWGSGQVVNLSSGYIKASEVPLYASKSVEAFKLANRIQKELAEGSLSKEMEEVLAELVDHHVVSRNIHFMDIDVEKFRGSSAEMMPERPEWMEGALPPSSPWNVGRNFREAGGDIQDELSKIAESGGKAPLLDRTKAGRKVHQGHRAWLKTGSGMNQWVEWMNRVPLYLTMREKGYSAKAAADVVERLHFDYSKNSAFFRDVVKRAIPFATFTAKMSKLVWDTLTQRPGGALGQMIRASRLASGDDPTLPEYVQQTAAIPVPGAPPDGTKRFMTGLGLAHEAPLSFLGGGVEGSLTELASMSNPLIKAPMELASGESFFQRGPGGGRDLTDMDPTIGRTISNVSEMVGLGPLEDTSGRAKPFISPGVEFILGNSPAARGLTTARQLTDTRKGAGAKAANLLTGLRISDVSPRAQDAVLQDILNAAMVGEGARQFSKPYFKGGPQTERQKNLDAIRRLLERRAREAKKQTAP